MSAHERLSNYPALPGEDPGSEAVVPLDDTALAELDQIGEKDEEERTLQRRAARLRSDMSLPYAMAVAGFIYPFCLLPVFFVQGMLERPSSHLSIWNVLTIMVGMAAAMPFTGFYASLMAFALSSVVWLAILGLARSLRAEFDQVRMGAHVGAWTAFLATTYYLATGGFWEGDGVYWIAMGCIAGPGIATPLAQALGAWSQLTSGEAPRPGRFRFGVYQILVVTAWVALLLTLLKLTSWPSRWVMVYLGGWLVYQGVTLQLVLIFCRWRYRRLAERRASQVARMVG